MIYSHSLISLFHFQQQTTQGRDSAVKDPRDLNDMLIFLAVIDAGSFTLAAERLSIPKANISRKVSRLEKQLGVTLLERTTRSQHLTEAGKTYLQHCKRIQEELDLAEASIAQVLNEVSGQLRIGASVGIGHEILKTTLGTFMHQYPDIDLQLNLLNRRVDLIEEGFDLVIRIGQLDDSRLIAKPLGKISRRLYVSPSYVEKYGPIKSIDDLPNHAFLLMSNVHGTGKFELQNNKQKKEFNVSPKLLVDDFLVLRQLVKDGLGIAILPDYMCTQDMTDKKLVQILPDWGMPAVDAYALYPKHRLNIPKVAVFLEYILKTFKERLLN